MTLPLGLGTGIVDDRETCIEMVTRALGAGYRHVDTAQGYENEAYVGEALDGAAVDREDVLVATKVLQHNLAYDDVHETARESLDRLGVEQVDLLYVHWPTHEYDPEETLAAFDELYEEGLAGQIGVCNATLTQLREARDRLDAPIAVYQGEFHPLWRSAEVVEYCRANGIDLVGYSPLGNGRALDHPTVEAVAQAHDASPAQVCLAWALARDVAPIPRGSGDHIEENLAARSLALSDDALARIDGIELRERVYDPDWAPWN